jgi:hypothetical protein
MLRQNALAAKFYRIFFTFLSIFLNLFMPCGSGNYNAIKSGTEISATIFTTSVLFQLVSDNYIRINTPAAPKTGLTVLMVLCVYSAPLYLLNAALLFRGIDFLTASPIHQQLLI